MQALTHSLMLGDGDAASVELSSYATPWLRLDSSDGADADDQFKLTERADQVLLRLVMCAAAATLVLALACSLGV
jgi:hypothetical protein